MKNEIQTRDRINEWLNGSFEEKIPDDIIALNFGIQKNSNGFEIYFHGYRKYDEHNDGWLSNSIYSPKNDLLLIENNDNHYSENEIYKVLKSEIVHFVKNQNSHYPKKVLYTTFTFIAGMPEVIYRQRNIFSAFKKVSGTLVIFMIIVTIVSLFIFGMGLLLLYYTWD